MSGIPPISNSIATAFNSGFARLNQGAEKVLAGVRADDAVEISGAGSPIEGDPLLAGIRDMMLARMQVKGGAALLHAWRENRESLFDLLK
jgi:hypothetical protein